MQNEIVHSYILEERIFRLKITSGNCRNLQRKIASTTQLVVCGNNIVYICSPLYRYVYVYIHKYTYIYSHNTNIDDNSSERVEEFSFKKCIVMYGCETLSLILRKERSLRMFKNRVLRRIFGPKGDEVKGE